MERWPTLRAVPSLALLAALLLVASLARAEVPDASCGPSDVTCTVATPAPATPPTPPPPPASPSTLVFFWGVGCPHCEEADAWLRALAAAHPGLAIERVEVRADAAGRARFAATARALGLQGAGIPTFVVGREAVVGYRRGVTERAVEAALRGARATGTVVHLPLVGAVDAARVPLPALTLAIGLVDGINPCAIWVLLVLLGILAHVRSRRRLVLFGAAFVLASGVVYFAFMSAWAGAFGLLGLSRLATTVLGALVLAMGLVNLKDVVALKRGVSLTIPDRVKPRLYRRMRAIANAAATPAALAGVVALALLVNLVELGCTLGLPAVYTRILSLRPGLGAAARAGYLALYNLAYVVPLAVIVAVYAATRRRLALGPRGARALKGVSGVLLVAFGLLFLFAPDALT